MTDRELLEAAAKAADNGAQWDCPERGMMILAPSGIDTMAWNPLTDDGDALRLAVKLRLDITHPDPRDHDGSAVYVTIHKRRVGHLFLKKLRFSSEYIPEALLLSTEEMDVGHVAYLKTNEPHLQLSIEAATRRAIVRAAAEIGASK